MMPAIAPPRLDGTAAEHHCDLLHLAERPVTAGIVELDQRARLHLKRRRVAVVDRCRLFHHRGRFVIDFGLARGGGRSGTTSKCFSSSSVPGVIGELAAVQCLLKAAPV